MARHDAARVWTMRAIAALAVSLPVAAWSQTTPPRSDAPAAAPPVEAVPTDSLRTGEKLGDALSRSDGVIRPPAGVDPEMQKPTPDLSAGNMPVIPPPGSPGGNPNVQPK